MPGVMAQPVLTLSYSKICKSSKQAAASHGTQQGLCAFGKKQQCSPSHERPTFEENSLTAFLLQPLGANSLWSRFVEPHTSKMGSCELAPKATQRMPIRGKCFQGGCAYRDQTRVLTHHTLRGQQRVRSVAAQTPQFTEGSAHMAPHH